VSTAPAVTTDPNQRVVEDIGGRQRRRASSREGALDRELNSCRDRLLDFKHIEAISEPMRELIEDLWPELADNLPPKAN
jgi:hypothetical protein